MMPLFVLTPLGFEWWHMQRLSSIACVVIACHGLLRAILQYDAENDEQGPLPTRNAAGPRCSARYRSQRVQHM